MRPAPVLVVALLVSGGAPARAQEQQASLDGVVRDSSGGVTPGVTIVVASPGGFTVEARTDDAGVYRFASVPPGTYELTARLPGFLPATVTGIDLRLGRQLTIDLTVQPAGVAETVAVTTESPLIAITQSARSTNLRGDQIEKMPKGRDFTSLATQAAGVNDEKKLGGLSVDGSSAAENRFIIDGMETTDTVGGLPGQPLVVDFVDELQVKSSGYSAEYGGSTGAVLNVVTKSGTNVWHGDLLAYWSGDTLDASPRATLRLNPADPDRAEYVTYPEDGYWRIEPGVTLGGPLVRDRLWMFAGYVPSVASLRRDVTFLDDGSQKSFRQDTQVHNIAANVVAAFASRWRARVAFSSGGQTESGQLPAQDGTGNPAADYDVDTVRPRRSGSAGVDYFPNAGLLVSARAGYFLNDFYNRGVFRGDRYIYRTSAVGMPGVPEALQQPLGYSNVPSNSAADREREQRFSALADATLFLSGGGQHQLKGGLQLDRISHDELSGSTGNVIALFWGQRFGGQSGPFGYYRIASNHVLPNLGVIVAGNVSVTNLGFYLHDNWRVGHRLTLNLGLRTENEHVPSFSDDPGIPSTAIHFGFADKLAPRVGFAWDVAGDGRTKAYGSWGVFYDIMKLNLPLASFGGAKGQFDYYTLDSGDISTIVDNPSCPAECPGRHLLGPLNLFPPSNDPADNLIDPGLEQTRLQEAVVGLERELRPYLSMGARYIHKQMDRTVEDIGTLTEDQDTIFLIGNPGFGRDATFLPAGGTTPIVSPKARRDYDAVETTLDKRLSHSWGARVSYTWSRLSGNDSGLSHSDFDGAGGPNTGFNFDYPMMLFDERGRPVHGVLATDRPHQIMAHALFDLPSGTGIGLQWFGASGTPRTRTAAYLPGNNFPVMYRGRKSDGRLPFLQQLDVYAQHQFRVGNRWHLTASVNVMNLLNGSTATNYVANVLFQGQAIDVAETDFYQGVDTEELIAAQGLARDARFLMDSEYQPPRSVRLGIKIGF